MANTKQSPITDTAFNTYKKLLSEFVALKSVSTDPAYESDILKTAQWLRDLLKSNGFESECITGYDNPIVYASYKTDEKKYPQAKTVLIYGHYDVQPADKQDGWKHDPFELTEMSFDRDVSQEKNDSNSDNNKQPTRLVARGAIDNKGQVMVHIATIIDLIKENRLAYNVKFFIEGNEETGSDNLESFIKDHADKLKSDFIVTSDGEITADHPIIEVGFRGVINAALTVQTSDNALHSGLYGGIAPNAAHILAEIIADMHTSENGYENKVAIDGFYQDVDIPTKQDLKQNSLIPFDEKEYQNVTGTKQPFKHPEYDVYTQLGFLPSIDVTGIQSGYTGVGFQNIIPGKATAKLNLRLTPSQNIEKIQKAVEAFVKKRVPDYAEYELHLGEGCVGALVETDNPVVERASSMLDDVYGRQVLKKYCGATLPIASLFQEILNVPQLFIPLANEDCNMHGVHENFRIDLAKKALAFSRAFFQED